MKYTLYLLSLVLTAYPAVAQIDSIEYLQLELDKADAVETEVDLLNKLSYAYTQLYLPSAESFAQSALEKATAVNYKKGMATSYNNLGITYSIQGDYARGLDNFIKALNLRETLKDQSGASKTLGNIARLFRYQGDFERAVDYSRQSIALLEQAGDQTSLAFVYISLGEIYLNMKDNAHALETLEKARAIFVRQGKKNQEGWCLLTMAKVFEANQEYEKALTTCFEAAKMIDVKTDLFTLIELYQSIGSIYSSMGNGAEAGKYLHKAMQLSDEGNDSNGSISSRLKLANTFRQFGRYDSALHYMDAYVSRYTDAFNAEKAKQLNTLEKVYEAEKKDKLLEMKNEEIRTQSVIITIISLLLVFISALGFVIYRYYKEKKQSAVELEKLNREIYEKHEEILAQSEELAQANEEIKRMNESLEAEVTLRAQKIEEQNRKLIDYAYFNAHSVRGPLARILGLTLLMERENDATQIKEYNSYLMACAQELDHVIKDINSKLE